jgi:glucose-1-phosphate thymidylyltransferase
MRAIILAGGYAKRLWPLTKDRPKPLLPIGDSCILDYIISKIKEVEAVDEIVLSTNKKFENIFREWITERGLQHVRVYPEPSLSEEEKLGPVRAMELILRELPPDEYLIVAGDNLFSLDLKEMVSFYRKVGAPVIALYDVNNLEDAKKYACVELDSQGRIIAFEEKPEHPKSTLASTGIYLLPWASLSMMPLYLSQGNPPDPIGKFIGWLTKGERAYGFKFSGYWYDIGSRESYASAQEAFAKRV